MLDQSGGSHSNARCPISPAGVRAIETHAVTSLAALDFGALNGLCCFFLLLPAATSGPGRNETVGHLSSDAVNERRGALSPPLGQSGASGNGAQ